MRKDFYKKSVKPLFRGEVFLMIFLWDDKEDKDRELQQIIMKGEQT